MTLHRLRWPELSSARPAEPTAGARDGVVAFALVLKRPSGLPRMVILGPIFLQLSLLQDGPSQAYSFHCSFAFVAWQLLACSRLSVGSKTDAFQPRQNSYQPEQLEKLTEAFNLVWSQIELVNGTAIDIRGTIESGMVRFGPITSPAGIVADANPKKANMVSGARAANSFPCCEFGALVTGAQAGAIARTGSKTSDQRDCALPRVLS